MDDDFDDAPESLENCPQCGRSYDEIDFEYQRCSKCGWSVTEKRFGKPYSPSLKDFESGEADPSTGEWI